MIVRLLFASFSKADTEEAQNRSLAKPFPLTTSNLA
jgi:hypothetical protein